MPSDPWNLQENASTPEAGKVTSIWTFPFGGMSASTPISGMLMLCSVVQHLDCVDLPQPEGPTIDTNSLLPTSIETSASAVNERGAENRCVTPLTTMSVRELGDVEPSGASASSATR